MDRLKKTMKYISAFAVPCLLCLFCFGIVWYQYLQDVPEKSRSWMLNDRYDSLTSPMESGQVFVQDVNINGQIAGFGLNFNVIDPSLDGILRVKMENMENGEVLMDYESDLSVISSTSYTCFTLDKPITEKAKRDMRITLSVEYLTEGVTSGQMLSLKKSSNIVDSFGALTENGKAADGSLAMLIISEVIGNLPVKYYWNVGFGLSIAAGIVMLIITMFPKKKALAVFLTLLSISTAYHFVLPVYSAPDEMAHYNTAYGISNNWLGVEEKISSEILKRKTDGKTIFTEYETNADTYKYFMQNISVPAGKNAELVKTEIKYLSGYKFPYLLSAASITLGRLAGLNGIATAMLARYMNLIFYCIAVTLAWHFMPFVKSGILAVAMLPIGIHVGTSVSYDSFTLAFGLLICALWLRLVTSKEKRDKKLLAFTAIVITLAAPLKSAYILLPLLILSVPAARFKNKKTSLVYKAAVLAFAAFNYLFNNTRWLRSMLRQSGKATGIGIVKKAASTAAKTARTTASTAAAAVPNFTVGHIITQPVTLLRLAINTFFTNFSYYFDTMIGGKLGYLNLSEVTINSLILTGFVIILILAYIPERDHLPVLNIWQKLWAAFIFIGTLGVLIVGCITWTPINYDIIWGFQGRYLLPVLPLAMLAMQSSKIVKDKDISSFLLYSLFTLNIFTVLNAFVEVFAR